MEISNQEYAKLVEEFAERSPVVKNSIFAFLTGGSICAFGQFLLNLWKGTGLSESDAGMMTSVTLIFISVLLTGLGLYHRLARFAGAGTLVPITGFANAMAAPAIEFKSEGFITGTAARMFQVAGPVLVYGISASMVYGFVYWLFTGI